MTENPHVTVDEAQVSRIRVELTNSLDDQQTARRHCVLFAIACPLGLFGCVTAAAWLGSGRIPSTVCDAMFLGAFVLSLYCSGAGLFGANIANDECANTAWKLRALDAEAVQTRRAFELARSGSPFVLFLRSFEAELAGLDYTGKQRGNIASGLARIRAARMNEFYVEDLSHLAAHRKWSAQLEVLRSIQKRYPAVLLGNTALSRNMREEFTQTGIIEVTIQAQDWWPIFLALSHRAYLIILYIEAASPMLLREMQHLGTHGLRYVIFADDAELRLLARAPGLGESFLASAIGRLNLGNVTALRELMGMGQEVPKGPP